MEAHGGELPGDWAVNLPIGDAAARGDEREAWATHMGPPRPIQAGRTLLPDPDFERAMRGSDATPSSYNTDKQFELMKDISTRFLPAFANRENQALNMMIQEAERELHDIQVRFVVHSQTWVLLDSSPVLSTA